MERFAKLTVGVHSALPLRGTRFTAVRVSTRMAPKGNTNAVASGEDRPRWTYVLPAPVRSLGRPLLQKWRYFYGVSREKLREKLAAPGADPCAVDRHRAGDPGRRRTIGVRHGAAHRLCGESLSRRPADGVLPR